MIHVTIDATYPMTRTINLYRKPKPKSKQYKQMVVLVEQLENEIHIQYRYIHREQKTRASIRINSFLLRHQFLIQCWQYREKVFQQQVPVSFVSDNRELNLSL